MKILKFALVLVFLVTSSCVHTQPSETKHVDLLDPKGEEQTVHDLQLRTLIYRQDELPLEKFFTNLTHGKYKKAFRKIDFSYKPGNNANEALAELLQAGYVPVYVSAVNKGTTNITISEKNFNLVGDEQTLHAIPMEDVPHEFSHVNPTAIAANVYNTGVIVVGFAAIMAVIVIARAPDGTNLGGIPIHPDEPFNDMSKHTEIDFRDYLISETVLEPGQSKKGLIFFRKPAGQAEASDKIEFIGN